MSEVASANCSDDGRGNTLLDLDYTKLAEGAQACSTGCRARGERRETTGQYHLARYHTASPQPPLAQAVRWHNKGCTGLDEEDGASRPQKGQEDGRVDHSTCVISIMCHSSDSRDVSMGMYARS